MREIKFRQFIEKGLFHYWGFTEDGFISPIHPNKSYDQYIGLKDKNKKEIYESDLVEFRTYGQEPNITRLGKVIYIGDMAQFLFKCPLSYLDYISFRAEEINKETIRVVGNIYENPELLK